MSETADKISRTLLAAFPDLRCLRCGNDAFSLTYGFDAELDEPTKLALLEAIAENKEVSLAASNDAEVMDTMFITLICERCGMLERHVRPIIELAEKPIEFAGARDAES